jgi:hypothetical protein
MTHCRDGHAKEKIRSGFRVKAASSTFCTGKGIRTIEVPNGNRSIAKDRDGVMDGGSSLRDLQKIRTSSIKFTHRFGNRYAPLAIKCHHVIGHTTAQKVTWLRHYDQSKDNLPFDVR